jgi:hypothetical protein
MKRLQPLLLVVGLLFTILGVGACGRQPLGSAGGDAPVDGSGGSAGTVACDDGTGATDCCLDTSTGACSTEGLSCWSRCSFPSAESPEGVRGQKFCGGGQWGAGHGVFPCSRAVSASDGGNDSSTRCTPGADQTCNDNPAVSALWGHCEATGVCTCNFGTTVSPTTGRCRS